MTPVACTEGPKNRFRPSPMLLSTGLSSVNICRQKLRLNTTFRDREATTGFSMDAEIIPNRDVTSMEVWTEHFDDLHPETCSVHGASNSIGAMIPSLQPRDYGVVAPARRHMTNDSFSLKTAGQSRAPGSGLLSSLIPLSRLFKPTSPHRSSQSLHSTARLKATPSRSFTHE